MTRSEAMALWCALDDGTRSEVEAVLLDAAGSARKAATYDTADAAYLDGREQMARAFRLAARVLEVER